VFTADLAALYAPLPTSAIASMHKVGGRVAATLLGAEPAHLDLLGPRQLGSPGIVGLAREATVPSALASVVTSP
jgi:hypothetical protein